MSYLKTIEGHTKTMPNQIIPVNEKYMLSINEAAQYFNIWVKKMRRLAEDNLGVFAVYSGNRLGN